MSGKRGKPKRKADSTLAQFGIFDIPDINDMGEDDDGDDDEGNDGDLEAELQALLSGKAPQRKPRQPPKKEPPTMMDVEKMAAECMKETASDDDDENLSGDEDLMAELTTLVPEASENKRRPKVESPVEAPAPPPPPKTSKPSPSSTVDLLSERIAMYKEAEAVSRSCGDTSKARRYGRAVKTLDGLIKSARAGNAISEEDIPPPVAIPKPKPPPPSTPTDSGNDAPLVSQDEAPPPPPPRQAPSRPAPAIPSETNSVLSNGDLSIGAQLLKRRDQYKIAALRAKKAGDADTAIKYVRIAKKFDAVIEAEKSGQPVDLSNMPPPPPGFASNSAAVAISDSKASQNRLEEKNQTSSQPSEMEAAALAAASGPEDPSVFNAPPPPSSVLEALQQRLEKFTSTRDSAKAEGNNSKARRLTRIVQQYETAIKNYKAGKLVDFEELPTPPGFAPIPVGGSAPAPQPQVAPAKPKPPMPPKEPKGEGAATPGPPSANRPAAPGQKGPSPPGANKGKLQRTNTSSVLEKQLNFLLERQKLFRQAALESKKNGDIQQAKEYLRMSKGFDSMIEATRSGLPIDATTIPTPPQLEADFVIIEKSDCVEETGEEESSEEVFRTIERDLEQQIEICTRNKEHFLRLGDVSSASKFEKLGLNSKKDLAVVRHKWLNNDGIPRFHYETRLFSMVQCHTDLGDNEIEVAVERGINLPGKPDDLDSYVRVELPLPPETPLRAKTHTVKDTNNPIFQETFKFEFNRKSRAILRHFKRQVLKLEIWSKGGFLRSDTLLGVASVKLVELESKCTIHDSFDLMEGRKACGGKIEVKVRIRDPLLAKQVEEVREKWLVIGS